MVNSSNATGWEINSGEGWPFQVPFAQKGLSYFSYVPGTLDRIIGIEYDGDKQVICLIQNKNGHLLIKEWHPLLELKNYIKYKIHKNSVDNKKEFACYFTLLSD